MFRRKNSQQASERATEYATCKDFQQIFYEEMPSLHQLAYLLTADSVKAEQCFVAGLDDSIHSNPVFKQWARVWSKRAVIQNAIKAMSPMKVREGQERAASPETGSVPPLVALVMQWPAFERFVFVMAVLEGYSIRECAAMLACSDREIIATKSHVLQRLGASEGAAALDKTGIWTALLAKVQVA